MITKGRALPDDWEPMWKRVQYAASIAADKRRKCPPTAMFHFVRAVMAFPWAEWWRNRPEEIASLIETMQAESDEKLRRSMNMTMRSTNFWLLCTLTSRNSAVKHSPLSGATCAVHPV